MRLYPHRLLLAATVALLVTLPWSAAPNRAQSGEVTVPSGEAEVAQYGGKPVAFWVDLLARHLDGETEADWEECHRAAQALGQIGPPAKEAIPLLVRALQSVSLEVRCFAVDALGRIGLEPETVVPAIVTEADLPRDHINYGPLVPFRRLAARALGRIGSDSPAAMSMLERALQNEDPLYRVQAAWALWQITRHPRTMPTLQAVLKWNDPDAAFEAVLVLTELGDDAKPLAPDLIEALDDPDGDVRRAAAFALVALGTSHLESIAERLSQDGFQWPAAAAYVLGRYFDQLRPTVFYDPQMNAESLAAASRPVVRLAAPALVRLLAHSDLEVRQTAVRSLAQMGLLAAPFLVQSLPSADATGRAAAIDALTRLEDYLPEAIPPNPGMMVITSRLVSPLMELMQHTEPTVRRAAYRAFARFSFGAEGKAAEPLLRAALRDQDLAIRRFAFEALQQWGEGPS